MLFSLSGCSRTSNPISATGFYFDTVITITLYNENQADILEHCMTLAESYEKLLSAYVEGSDIWNINHSSCTYVTVSDETIELLKVALSYSELSDGLVSPVIGSLSSLWNFGSGNQGIVPDDKLISNALAHTDYHIVEIVENRVRLSDTEASLDLGFIAKGYIGDKIKEYLVSEGISSGIINLGGNVVAIGNKPDGNPFRIGVQKPFENSGTPALTLDITDTSVVSSGNYERYFIKDDTLYHHILSTQTGYPADTGLLQATILCKSSTDADALSTLCFLLGYEKAAQLLESFPDTQAVFITTDGEINYINFN